MATEVDAQKLVHTLDEGKGKWWIWMLVFALGTGVLFMLHIWSNPLARRGQGQTLFRGLTESKGMEQAVIARELSRGNGFTTKMITPAAIRLIEKNKGESAFNQYIKYDADAGYQPIPDIFHAPLWPWINSKVFSTVVVMNDKIQWRVNSQGRPDYWSFRPNERVHPADRLIASVAALFMIGGILVNYFTFKRLFDQRLALFVTGLCLLCEYLWESCFTGQPQMFLFFMFSVAAHALLRAVTARGEGKTTLGWTALAGVMFGLMALTHSMSLLIAVGAAIYAGLALRPWWRDSVLILVLAGAISCGWYMRLSNISGSMSGLAGDVSLFQIRGSESQIMRTLKKEYDEKIELTDNRAKLQGQLQSQSSRLLEYTGGIIVAPVFFLALLQVFKRRETASFKWGALAMLLFTIAGMCWHGLDTPTHHSMNFYPIFVPLMTAYGMAIVLMMWARLEIPVRLINVCLGIIPFGLSAMPFFNAMTGQPPPPVVFPPYYPPIISELGKWYDNRDVVMSDMPWAVAWYADRYSLWLPYTLADYHELNDFRFTGRITGMLLTPQTGYAPLNDVVNREYREWKDFILRQPRAGQNFPLQAMLPAWSNVGYVLYSDRDRWTERND